MSTEESNVIDICDEGDAEPSDKKHFFQQRNIPKQDVREDEGKGYHHKVTLDMMEEKVKVMKGYLLTIASAEPAEDTPLPHLEHHQAWLLFVGNQKGYKSL